MRIRAGKWKAHACFMISATVVSAAFLACYLTYHAIHGEKSTKLHAHDWLRNLYLLVLLPHLVLAVGMLPMIYLTLLRAYRRQWPSHRAIALPTFWIWMYVSFSGVVVYFLATAWLLGRIYFELAAMRFHTPLEAKALRKRNATTVYIGGLLIAVFVSIPVVNLATPLFATALMVHVHKRLVRGT